MCKHVTKSLIFRQARVKVEVAKILKEEGFITDFSVGGDDKKTITVTLKYGPNNEKVISGIKRISKPGLRVYAEVDKLPRVLNGLGIAIISTSSGITDRQAMPERNMSVAKSSLTSGKRGAKSCHVSVIKRLPFPLA
ncbi:MAG: 30S ribosomal protein S8 [Bacillus subtilis]|nr:30S ribosomal protein S8 [Bacillus subtilis]